MAKKHSACKKLMAKLDEDNSKAPYCRHCKKFVKEVVEHCSDGFSDIRWRYSKKRGLYDDEEIECDYDCVEYQCYGCEKPLYRGSDENAAFWRPY